MKNKPNSKFKIRLRREGEEQMLVFEGKSIFNKDYRLQSYLTKDNEKLTFWKRDMFITKEEIIKKRK